MLRTSRLHAFPTKLPEARARIRGAGRCVLGAWSTCQACSRPAIKRVHAQKGEEPASEVGVLPAPTQRCSQGLCRYLAFLLIYYGQQKMKLEKGKGNTALVGLTVRPWERGGVICIVNATLPWRGTELGWNSDLIPLSI